MNFFSSASKGTCQVYSYITKAFTLFQNEGLLGFKKRLRYLFDPSSSKQTAEDTPLKEYAAWIKRFDTISSKSRKKFLMQLEHFTHKPVISIIMRLDAPSWYFLSATINSVKNQIYPYWKLCIVSDETIKPAYLQLLLSLAVKDPRIQISLYPKDTKPTSVENALEGITGQYITFLNQADLLAEHALYWIANEINLHPDANLIYSDEDIITHQGKRTSPNFKPEFNYELFLARNMIAHLAVYRKSVVDAIGGWRDDYQGAQEYDLALRVIEQISWDTIHHIPRILYHQRDMSTQPDLHPAEASRNAIKAHLERQQSAASVTPAPHNSAYHRVRFALPEPKPLVSIIIPTKDRADLLANCISSIIKRSTYPHYEIIVVNNRSCEPATFDLFEKLKNQSIQILEDDSPFNYSALNNHAAKYTQGSVLCLMNNDIEIITPDWLEEMLSFAMRPDVGCVGARLLFPNGMLQHGGVVTGLWGISGHIHHLFKSDDLGYQGRAVLHQSLSAVTGACLIVRKNVFDAVSGLDHNLAVEYNDIDFCLRVKKLGYRNIWTPYAEMIHHESATRGPKDTLEKMDRYKQEALSMQNRWGELLLQDPAYNPNLTLDWSNMSLAWPPRVSEI